MGQVLDEGLFVKLDAFDLSEALLIAERRNAIRTVNHSTKQFDDGTGSFERNYLGAIGEVAFAKYFELPPNRFIASGGDGGVDYTMLERTIQVKCGSVFHGNKPDLIFRTRDYFQADIAVLTRVVNPVTVELVGCISKARFLRECQVKNMGHGQHYFIPAAELTHVDRLKEPREN